MSVALIPPSGIPRCPRSTQVASYRNLMKWAEQVHFRDAGSIFGSLELGKADDVDVRQKCARSETASELGAPSRLVPTTYQVLPHAATPNGTVATPPLFQRCPEIVSLLMVVEITCSLMSCTVHAPPAEGSATMHKRGGTRNILTISPSDPRSVTRSLSPASSPERHQ